MTTLDRIAAEAERARCLELEVVELEERLSEKKAELRSVYDQTLPDLLLEAGVDRIGVPARGNEPARDYRLVPVYAASISSRWPEDKKRAAFDVLRKYRAESLIKTEVVTRFARGASKEAASLAKKLIKSGLSPEVKESVHAQTLTAWLRETYERGRHLPQSELEAIGGFVSRVARPERRD